MCSVVCAACCVLFGSHLVVGIIADEAYQLYRCFSPEDTLGVLDRVRASRCEMLVQELDHPMQL